MANYQLYIFCCVHVQQGRLHKAIKQGELDTVKQLVKSADLNKKDNNGVSVTNTDVDSYSSCNLAC